MPPKAKRAREETVAAATEAPALKKAKSEVVKPEASAADRNGEILDMFEHLMWYEIKGGNKYAGTAYKKVADVVRKQKAPITSGSCIASFSGVGKVSVEKIDELLALPVGGKIKKILEFEEALGDISVIMGTTGGAKSGAGATAGKSAGKAAAGQKLTAAEKKSIQKAIEELSEKNLEALKQMMRDNDQKVGGTKPELVQRAAEGKVLGAIPRCPLCSGGKPTFDIKTGLYTCKGFMDDDEWAPCSYSSGSLARIPWK